MGEIDCVWCPDVTVKDKIFDKTREKERVIRKAVRRGEKASYGDALKEVKGKTGKDVPR